MGRMRQAAAPPYKVNDQAAWWVAWSLEWARERGVYSNQQLLNRQDANTVTYIFSADFFLGLEYGLVALQLPLEWLQWDCFG